jgi:hypothetical protein
MNNEQVGQWPLYFFIVHSSLFISEFLNRHCYSPGAQRNGEAYGAGIHSGGFDCRAASRPWEEESAAIGKKSRNEQ